MPDGAQAAIDVRTVPGLGADGVLEALRAAIGSEEVALETWVALDPVVTDPEAPFVARVYDVLGAPAEPQGLAYFTDAAALAPAYGGVPTVICGPGEPGQAHQTDEWAEVARLEAAAEAYFELARSWSGS